MSKVNWFADLVNAAGHAGYGVEISTQKNTGGPYLEIEVGKFSKDKPRKVIDSEKVKRSESVEAAAKRLLIRMKQEAQL